MYSSSPSSEILDSNSSHTLCANRQNNQMTETSFIATALVSLAQAIYNMNTRASSAAMMLNVCTPLLYPYNTATPFGLYSWAGSTADAYTPLSGPLDGQVVTFPSFIVNIFISANKVKWNATAPHGTLSVSTGGNNNPNILTKYQSIFFENTADVLVNRTDDCSI